MSAKPHILIVEDEADIRDSLQDFLEGEGYSISAARNGREALELLPTLVKLKLIILDLMMPVMGGAEFVSHCASQGISLRTPILLLSADSNTEKKASALRIADHLRKPIDLDELIAKVRKHVVA